MKTAAYLFQLLATKSHCCKPLMTTRDAKKLPRSCHIDLQKYKSLKMRYVILGQIKKMQLFYYSAVNSKSRIR